MNLDTKKRDYNTPLSMREVYGRLSLFVCERVHVMCVCVCVCVCARACGHVCVCVCV